MDIKMVKNRLLVFLTAGHFPPLPAKRRYKMNIWLGWQLRWTFQFTQLLVPHTDEGKRH